TLLSAVVRRRPPGQTAKGDRQTMKETLPAVGATGPQPSEAPSSRPDTPGSVPYTQVHFLLRRTLEHLQDVIALLVLVLLLVLSLQALWGLAQKALFEKTTPTELLSEVVFVLILTE